MVVMRFRPLASSAWSTAPCAALVVAPAILLLQLPSSRGCAAAGQITCKLRSAIFHRRILAGQILYVLSTKLARERQRYWTVVDWTWSSHATDAAANPGKHPTKFILDFGFASRGADLRLCALNCLRKRGPRAFPVDVRYSKETPLLLHLLASFQVSSSRGLMRIRSSLR